MVEGHAEVVHAGRGEEGEVGKAVAAVVLGGILLMMDFNLHQLPPVVGAGSEGGESTVEADEELIVGFSIDAVGIGEKLAESPVVGCKGLCIGLVDVVELLGAVVETLEYVLPVVGKDATRLFRGCNGGGTSKMEGGFVVGDCEQPKAVETLGERKREPHRGVGFGEVFCPLVTAVQKGGAQPSVAGCMEDGVAVHTVAEQGVVRLDAICQQVIEPFVTLVFCVAVGGHQRSEHACHAVEGCEPLPLVFGSGGFVVALFRCRVYLADPIGLVRQIPLQTKYASQGTECLWGEDVKVAGANLVQKGLDAERHILYS